MTQPHQFFGEPGNDPLRSAIGLRWNTFEKRRDLCNSHEVVLGGCQLRICLPTDILRYYLSVVELRGGCRGVLSTRAYYDGGAIKCCCNSMITTKNLVTSTAYRAFLLCIIQSMP